MGSARPSDSGAQRRPGRSATGGACAGGRAQDAFPNQPSHQHPPAVGVKQVGQVTDPPGRAVKQPPDRRLQGAGKEQTSIAERESQPSVALMANCDRPAGAASTLYTTFAQANLEHAEPPAPADWPGFPRLA